jgi:hypothetical protein
LEGAGGGLAGFVRKFIIEGRKQSGRFENNKFCFILSFFTGKY